LRKHKVFTLQRQDSIGLEHCCPTRQPCVERGSCLTATLLNSTAAAGPDVSGYSTYCPQNNRRLRVRGTHRTNAF